MVIRPEDKGKAIALGSAVVVVGAFIVFRIISDSAGPPPKEAGPVESLSEKVTGNSAVGAANTAVSNTNAATQQTVSAATGTPQPGSPTAKPVNPTGDIEVPAMYANNTSDPFRTVIPKPAATTQGSPQPKPDQGTKPPRIGAIDPIGGNGGPPPNLFVMPDIKVLGVVTGDEDVAVIKMGDKNFVAHVGDALGSGMVVHKITRSGISVKLGKQSFDVPMQ